ncbi:MAG: endonuclease VIII [Pseudomonadota bacterium]
MPEGPEMQRAADEIAAVLLNKKAQTVSFGLPALQRFTKKLAGRRVTSVTCRGKAVLIGFSGGLTIFTHNQLYGRWYMEPVKQRPNTKRQLRLCIETNKHAALLYSASNIAVLDQNELKLHPYLSKLGPDALDSTFSAAQLSKRLNDVEFSGRGLSSLYLDQGFLGGIGNYLRSEILFKAGINPTLKANELSAVQRDRLARVSLSLTRRSYKTGGVTNDPKIVKQLRGSGVPWEKLRFFVFARAGRPCHVCGTKVRKTQMAGRRLYFCPKCQA